MRSTMSVHQCQSWRLRTVVMAFIVISCTTIVISLPAELMVKVNEKNQPDNILLQRALKPRTLVLLDGVDDTDYTEFLSLLIATAHQLTMETLDSVPSLLLHGVPLYDNIVLIGGGQKSPSSSREKQVEKVVEVMIDFVEKFNGNIFVMGVPVAARPGAAGSAAMKQCVAATLTQRLGYDLGSSALLPVHDFIGNFEKNSEIVKAVQTLSTEGVFSSKLLASPIAYEGISHLLPNHNLLPFSLLHASPTTFTEFKGKVVTSGSVLALVSALQTRTNSRIVVSGSSSLCSNRLIKINPANLQFCQEVAEWNFQRRGVIDWSRLYHRKVQSATHQDIYRLNDDIEFQIDLHQLNPDGMAWAPFAPSIHLQIEFTMMDTHYRLQLTPHRTNQTVAVTTKDYKASVVPKGDATYSVSFKCPDRIGIFKFVVRLAHKGFSFLHVETLAPVRTYMHDDYERFLWKAYPYYASAFTAILLAVLFVILFIHLPEKTRSE